MPKKIELLDLLILCNPIVQFSIININFVLISRPVQILQIL